MVEYLRGEELAACVHRIALSRGEPFAYVRPALAPEILRRRSAAERFRRSVLVQLATQHPDAVTTDTVASTREALAAGVTLILAPHLPGDDAALRRARVHALARVGRRGATWTYSPIVIRHGELVEPAATRRTPASDLDQPWPQCATYVDGVGVRSTASTLRTGLAVVHALHVLASLDRADDQWRGGVVDRNARIWWLDLASSAYPRFNRHAYERHYEERVAVVRAHERWRVEGGPFPTAPAWHRECLECEYAPACQEQLEARDDVSLTRFTTLDQQAALREFAVDTRYRLARLDPARVRDAPLGTVEAQLGRVIENLDALIYRARAHERGPLRTVPPNEVGCPTADVEVDVDMESYDNRTYLWGALVTCAPGVVGVAEGYRSFVDWRTPTDASEGTLFVDFWRWLRDLRQRTEASGHTWRAYCFWAFAEDTAMNRALAADPEGAPATDELAEFRRARPAVWIDVHARAKAAIQTEGPTGLKVLATMAGFRWRDPSPSGEASMAWFEVARGEGDEAGRARQRLLEYNEDDCRATRALRQWLNADARTLPHRDEPMGTDR